MDVEKWVVNGESRIAKEEWKRNERRTSLRKRLEKCMKHALL